MILKGPDGPFLVLASFFIEYKKRKKISDDFERAHRALFAFYLSQTSTIKNFK